LQDVVQPIFDKWPKPEREKVAKKGPDFYKDKHYFIPARQGSNIDRALAFTITNIVSKGGEETLYVCRCLLSKSECPFWVAHQHFIVERKEGETG
jgi:hypothetical protein